MNLRASVLLSAALICLVAQTCKALTSAPDEAAFRDLYKQLIEINTTRSVGSCTQAAEAMRARLLAADIPAIDTQILAPADRPKDGALIAAFRPMACRACSTTQRGPEPTGSTNAFA